MQITGPDHISLVSRDLERSLAFYRDVLGLRRIGRPAFKSNGAWMASGTLEVHLTTTAGGNLRPSPDVDTSDSHFAVRVTDFDATLRHLGALGYSADLPDGDRHRLVLRLDGPAPYRQLYLVDPDNHLIEINDAPVKTP